MTPPLLLPEGLFNVEHRLDGGPNYDGQGFGPFTTPGLTFGNVIHTTETPGVPGYSGGVHPHLTYVPVKRLWVQHLPFDRRAGTLRGASTVENGQTVPTNRANVHQIEICAYSDYNIAAKYGRLAIRDLAPADRQEIAKWIRWQYDLWGSGQPLIWFPYARTAAGIMRHADWIPADGKRKWTVIDHWGAPDDSSHWDSGAIDRTDIMARVAALGNTGPSEPPPPPDPMGDWPNTLRRGDTHPAVAELRVLLRKAFCLGPTMPWLEPQFTSMVHYGVRKFQGRHKDAAGFPLVVDGIVGDRTRQALRGYL